MTFIVIGGYFVLNLFIGMMVHKYSFVRKSGSMSSLLLSTDQADWLNRHKDILTNSISLNNVKIPPPRKLKFVRLPIYRMINSTGFEQFIAIVIMINGLSIAVEHFNQVDSTNFMTCSSQVG